jgi:hypothetical protein
MEAIPICFLIFFATLVYCAYVWRSLRRALDEEVVPTRWDEIAREENPKFYWFQIIRMIVVLVVGVLVMLACILGPIVRGLQG